MAHFSAGPYALQGARLVHCTSAYLARASRAQTDAYLQKPEVRRALGGVAPLALGAFLLTPSTLGARVLLTEAQAALMHETRLCGSSKRRRRWLGPRQELASPAYAPDALGGPQTLREEPGGGLAGGGLGAHVTLGTARGVRPVTAGLELLRLLEGAPGGLRLLGEEYPVPGGGLRDHGAGFWGVYPDERLVVDALFTCHL